MTGRLVVWLLVLSICLCAERRVDPRNTYQRILVRVPMVGKGTPDDPRRPMYAPWPPTPSNTGIIAFAQQVSDDGQSALVEFVARDRAALQAILRDKQVKVFEKGKSRKDDVEQEFRKAKRDFDPDKLRAVAP